MQTSRQPPARRRVVNQCYGLMPKTGVHRDYNPPMCGRYAILTPWKILELFGLAGEHWGFDERVLTTPRYNIAPTQPALVARNSHAGQREVAPLMWGLVPQWADDPKIGQRMINARSETAATKPAFRAAMRYRRCLIPADHFYEWKREGKARRPIAITMADEAVFAFAGLWEHYQTPDGSELETFTVLTCEPNEMMADIHDRMPVIVDRDDYDRWLDPSIQKADEVADLLKPYPAELMASYPVSTGVNSAKNTGKQCVEPMEKDTLF